MLFFISDLHLSDGSTGLNIASSAFDKLAERLVEMAINASWRESAIYKPIAKIDIILLGDIFDMIRSTRWQSVYLDCAGEAVRGVNPTNVRPWDITDPNRIQDLANLVDLILDEILLQNQGVFQKLRLISDHGISIPAEINGKPDPSKQVVIPVLIHEIVGNHDWLLCVDHPAFNKIRSKIIQAIGLCPKTNEANKPFPHDSLPFPAYLEQIIKEHSSFIRHGDVGDSANYDTALNRRDRSSFGDAFVIDWLCRFSLEAALHPVIAKSPNYESIIYRLREMDNIRPFFGIFSWLQGSFKDFPEEETILKNLWESLGKEFLSSVYPKAHKTHFWNVNSPYAIYRYLHLISKLSWRLSSKFVQLFCQGAGVDCCLAYAKKDALIHPDRKFFIAGHMHMPDMVPLRVESDSNVAQLYLNTGTWKPIHMQTALNSKALQFDSYNMMTFVVTYQGDERGGLGYESWSGTLDIKGKL